MKIAYQGEPGAFSEAAPRLVSSDASLIPCKSFEDVFAVGRAGDAARMGCLPIENSIGGSIHRNYDLLIEHDLPIVGEVELPVVHHLLALPGTPIDGVQRIYSHPQALAQCERFLRTLTGVESSPPTTRPAAPRWCDEQAARTRPPSRPRGPARSSDSTPLASSIQDFATTSRGSSSSAGTTEPDAPPTRPRSSSRCQRAGRAVQGAERVRAARHRPDEARVASDSGPALGIPLLRRPRRGADEICRARARSRTWPNSHRRCGRSARIPAGSRETAVHDDPSE